MNFNQSLNYTGEKTKAKWLFQGSLCVSRVDELSVRANAIDQIFRSQPFIYIFVSSLGSAYAFVPLLSLADEKRRIYSRNIFHLSHHN